MGQLLGQCQCLQCSAQCLVRITQHPERETADGQAADASIVLTVAKKLFVVLLGLVQSSSLFAVPQNGIKLAKKERGSPKRMVSL